MINGGFLVVSDCLFWSGVYHEVSGLPPACEVKVSWMTTCERFHQPLFLYSQTRKWCRTTTNVRMCIGVSVQEVSRLAEVFTRQGVKRKTSTATFLLARFLNSVNKRYERLQIFLKLPILTLVPCFLLLPCWIPNSISNWTWSGCKPPLRVRLITEVTLELSWRLSLWLVSLTPLRLAVITLLLLLLLLSLNFSNFWPSSLRSNSSNDLLPPLCSTSLLFPLPLPSYLDPTLTDFKSLLNSQPFLLGLVTLEIDSFVLAHLLSLFWCLFLLLF